MICNDTTNMFGGQFTCARDDHHKGDHQTAVIDGQIAQWSDGGGSRWWVNHHRYPNQIIITCPSCGILHVPESNRLTKGGTVCFHCIFWTRRMAQYINGEIMVIEGRVYSWGAKHGYGGAEFTITTEDGVTTTKRGLWNGGVVPWEYREVMPDNATFGESYRSTDRVQP